MSRNKREKAVILPEGICACKDCHSSSFNAIILKNLKTIEIIKCRTCSNALAREHASKFYCYTCVVTMSDIFQK